MRRLLLIPIMIILFSSFASATGLTVTNQTSFTVNKIYNQNLSITFNLQNTESFSMYNIRFSNLSVIEFPTIARLDSGQSAIITAIVKTNDVLSNSVQKIIGFYNATLGSSHANYSNGIDYYVGFQGFCDKSIIRGDSVNWINNVPDTVTLRNVDTGLDITTMNQNTNYQTTFNEPTTLRYMAIRRGFIFTSICTLTVLNDVGLITNPQYDGSIILSTTIDYNPTNLTSSILQTAFTMNAWDVKEGVLTVSNTGNMTAKNIRLTNEWGSFSPNNFDLEPGQTRAIVLTIRPYLQNTAETNTTHYHPLTVIGNFPTITHNMSYYVNYAVVNGSNYTSQYQSLKDAIDLLCRQFPDAQYCQSQPTVVFVGNSSSDLFSFNMSQDQLKKLFEYQIQMGDQQTMINNFLKENLANISDTVKQINDMKAQLDSDSLKAKDSQDNLTYVIFFTLFLACSTLIGGLIYMNKIKNDRRKVNTF